MFVRILVLCPVGDLSPVLEASFDYVFVPHHIQGSVAPATPLRIVTSVQVPPDETRGSRSLMESQVTTWVGVSRFSGARSVVSRYFVSETEPFITAMTTAKWRTERSRLRAWEISVVEWFLMPWRTSYFGSAPWGRYFGLGSLVNLEGPRSCGVRK